MKKVWKDSCVPRGLWLSTPTRGGENSVLMGWDVRVLSFEVLIVFVLISKLVLYLLLDHRSRPGPSFVPFVLAALSGQARTVLVESHLGKDLTLVKSHLGKRFGQFSLSLSCLFLRESMHRIHSYHSSQVSQVSQLISNDVFVYFFSRIFSGDMEGPELMDLVDLVTPGSHGLQQHQTGRGSNLKPTEITVKTEITVFSWQKLVLMIGYYVYIYII